MLIFFLTLITTITELSLFLTSINGLNNVWLFTIYTFVEGTIILIIITRKVNIKVTKVVSYFCILILALLTFTTFYNSLSTDILNITEAFFVFVFAIYYFAYLFQKAEVPVLTRYYFFWINSAFVFYFAVNLFMGGAEHFFQKSIEGNHSFLYAYHLVTNIIYNILLSIGVWKIKVK